MIAIDANVLLRLVLGDDEQQRLLVVSAMERDTLFVPLTVFLETGWVLQSRYKLDRGVVADALEAVLDLEGVEVARPALAAWAVVRYRKGADLADVIHVAASAKHDRFLTFDRKLAKLAGPSAPVHVELLA